MIKKNQQYINIIMVLLDIISITAAYLLSWYFRFLTPIFGTAVHSVPFPIYISTLWVIIPVYLILFKFLGLYDPHRKKSLQTEIRGIVVANVIGFLIVIAWLFTQRQVDYSRYALLLFILFCIFLLSYERTFIRLFLRNIRRKGYNLKHLIIIGAGENGRQFVKRVKENTYLG
jgi:FlaA1/EpsC-like NDP-sugar epimerase